MHPGAMPGYNTNVQQDSEVPEKMSDGVSSNFVLKTVPIYLYYLFRQLSLL